MKFDTYLEWVRHHASALRAAAVTAGPDTAVPTAPEWTVRHLVRHVARVHSWVTSALDTDPDGPSPEAERPPEDWDSLLQFWDKRLTTLVDRLGYRGPDSPAWTFGSANTTGWWARRMAHETAIHRLDAEHAAHGDAVDHLTFTPEFAADGIDEALTVMIARRPIEVTGTVLYHAADAGRAWLVTATEGQPPLVGPAVDIESDASVVGTADAVYRRVWNRPSTAVVGGDRTLVDGLRTP